MRERTNRWKTFLLNPSADWTFRLFFAAILLFVLLTRLTALSYKPFHHDESLFSTYGYWQYTLGNYDHHPLLHGPLQIQLLSLIFRVTQWLGLMTNHGNAIARLLSATCGVLLLFLIPSLRRKIGREGIVLALAWVAISPGIWYYQRFVRNESLFLLSTLALMVSVLKAWRSPKPGRWIIAGCLSAALLIAEKENCLFILFNGAFFLALVWVFEKTKSAPARFLKRSPGSISLVFRSFKTQRYAWVVGLSLAFVLLSLVYTNGFKWHESFPHFYLRIMRYWGGQHEEHRLYGEFHHYLPILFLYEPLVMLVLLIAIARLIFHQARIIGAALLFASVVFGLWMGSVGNHWISPYLPQAPVPKEQTAGNLLGWLHMTHAWHLALTCGVAWIAVWGAWTCLRQKRVFRSWLVLWSGFSLLQYSYAGEKVPWLALHIMLPCILLAADLLGEWWRKNTSHFGRQQIVVGVVVLFWCLNALQGYRLCFVHPANPGELLVYNHTQFPLHEVAMEMRQNLLATKGKIKVVVQGESVWPLVWYLRGFSYLSGVEQKGWTKAAYVICDVSYADKHPELDRYFNMERLPFRQAFTPKYAPLHLFTLHPASDQAETSSNIGAKTKLASSDGFYGRDAWKALIRYLITRQPWEPSLTADPLDVSVGRNRNLTKPIR